MKAALDDGPPSAEPLWSLLESAWRTAPAEAALRPSGGPAPSVPTLDRVDEALEKRVIPALREALRELPAEELAAVDRILEHELYALDRADIQKHTDGSDDGFLYARGFIVAMGRAYYDAVVAHPETAIMDRECQSICYLPKRLHEDLHGPLPPSRISRETGSNKAGWKV